MAFSKVLIFLVAVAAASAKVATFHGCSGVSKAHCDVLEVRITPCLKSKCELARLENASISFDFTPKFSATKLHTGIYYNDIAFNDMNSNACELTSCPTEAGKTQTLHYQLYIGNMLPKGIYPINFKVWNEDNPEEICCFQSSISIPKKKV